MLEVTCGVFAEHARSKGEVRGSRSDNMYLCAAARNVFGRREHLCGGKNPPDVETRPSLTWQSG